MIHGAKIADPMSHFTCHAINPHVKAKRKRDMHFNLRVMYSEIISVTGYGLVVSAAVLSSFPLAAAQLTTTHENSASIH